MRSSVKSFPRGRARRIEGEVYTCPECGASTEVYSRITGYYRPVQNWNDGKSQEFKERIEYNISTSKLKRNGPKVKEEDDILRLVTEEELGRPLLITTRTCPNCKVAISMLDRAGIESDTIVADEEPEVAKRYGITQAPTLVAAGESGIELYAGIMNVKKFAEGSVLKK